MLIRLLITILALNVSVNAEELQIHKPHDTLEVYFDTPSLSLLENNASLKYQAIKYLSTKKQKIKYNESIIYISSVQKKHQFEVKHYNSVKFLEEKHPLLALVKRKDRKRFRDILKNDGIKHPMKLKYVFERTYSSKDSSEKGQNYKQLITKKMDDDMFFKIKFQYPYFVNLFYALSMGIIGFGVILLLSQKRRFK